MDFYKLIRTLDTLNESSSMQAAEKHHSGPEFGGYWKGTDKGTPKPGQGVGGCEESVDVGEQNMGPGTGGMEEEELIQELRKAWAEFQGKDKLDEFGGNNPGQNQAATASQTAQDANQIKQGLQSLKQKVPGIDVSKASNALTKTDTNQQVNPSDQAAVSNSLSSAVADVVKNPQLTSQLKSVLDKGQQMAMKQQQGGQ